MSLSRTGAGVAAIALSGLAVLGVQAPAFAAPGDCPVGQHYSPKSGCVDNGASVDHRNFNPGGKGTVSGTGFKPGSSAQLWLHSDPVLLGTYTATGSGAVTADFSMPVDVPPGDHHLELLGVDAQGRPLSVSVPIFISGRATTAATSYTSPTTSSTSAGSSQLPRTGTEVGIVAVAGLALVGAGVGAVYAGRRRRVLV